MRRIHWIYCALAIILISPAAWAGEMYHMVRIPAPNDDVVKTLAGLGLPLDDATKAGNDIDIPLRESDVARLVQEGVLHEIVQKDLEAAYGRVCRDNKLRISKGDVAGPGALGDGLGNAPQNIEYGSMGGFYNYDEILAELDQMRSLYPDLITARTSIGKTGEDRDIWTVKISDNADTDEDEPECLIDGIHHAREPGTYTAMIYAMWYLLENYGSDSICRYLVDNRELYFVPVVNVDGFLYNVQNNPDGGGMWRKNRRDNGDGWYGVDPNRNYPYKWGYDNNGSSSNASSDTYRGPSAGSEPCVQVMMTFARNHIFKTAMSIHSYSGLYMYAYGYADVQPEHPDIHAEYTEYMARGNGYDVGPIYSTIYAANGVTTDWQLNELDIISITPEIGVQGFWPPVDSIMVEAAQNLRAHLHMFWCAGGKTQGTDLVPADGALTPGTTEDMALTIKNLGMSASEDVTVDLTSSDSYVTITSGTWPVGILASRAETNNSASPFKVAIEADCPTDHAIRFDANITFAGYTGVSSFIKITAQDVNRNPIAVDDTGTPAEDTEIVINVIANDSDPDGDVIQVSSVTQAQNGTVICGCGQTPPVNVRYIPNENFHGTDTFTYMVVDTKNGYATGTVTVTVTPVNDAPVAMNDSVTMIEDTTVTVAVLVNDSDVDGDALTVASVAQGSNGTAVICDPPTCVNYTPNAGFTGTDSFSYTVSDGELTDTAVVTVSVTPAGETPEGLMAHWKLDESNGVTAADSSPNGNEGTLSGNPVWAPGKLGGALQLDGNDRVLVPTSESLEITEALTLACWMKLDLMEGRPRMVNKKAHWSSAAGYFFEAWTDTGLVKLIGDGSSTARATVELEAGVWHHYAVTAAGGTAQIYYDGVPVTMSDATVTLSQTDAADLKLGGGLKGLLDDVRIYDSALSAAQIQALVTGDSPPPTYTITASSTMCGTIGPSGAVEVEEGESQTFTMTPNADCELLDVLVDGESVGATASYTFTNVTADHTIAAQFAQIAPEQYTLTVNTAGTGSGSVSPPSGTYDEGTVVTLTATPNGDSTFDGWSGAVSGTTNPAQLTMDADKNVTATFNLIPVYSITATAGTGGSIDPSGTVSVSEGGSQTFTITANDGYDINDVVVDGGPVGAVSSYAFDNVTGDHTIHVGFSEQPEPNRPPAAADDSAGTEEDTPVDIAVLDNDTDPDGDSLIVSDVSAPSDGSAVSDGTVVTYTPDAGFTGTDSFSYSAGDGELTDTAVVTVTVTPAGETPEGLIGYWKLDEASGVRMDDSDQGNDLADTGGVGASAGKVGQAAEFSGANYLSISDTAQTGMDIDGSLTVAAWIRPDTVSGWQIVLGKYDYPNSQRAYRLHVSSGKLALVLSTQGTDYASVSGATVLNVEEWTHVAGVFDGAEQTVTLYIDGEVEKPATAVGFSTLHNSTAPFMIGANANGTGAHQFFDGLIDEARVYADVLTQEAIRELMAGTTPPNRPPIAENRSVTVDEDSSVDITLGATDADGDALTYEIVAQPVNGLLSNLNAAAGTVTYTPNADYSGGDSLTFLANDGKVDSNVATVSITVVDVNDPPIAVATASPTLGYAPLTVVCDGSGSSDADGTIVDWEWDLDGVSEYGETVTHTYTAPGTYTVTLYVFDDDGASDSAPPLTIEVTLKANVPPVAENQAVALDEDASVAITFRAQDADGDALTYSIVDSPGYGELTGTAPNVAYVPDADYYGADSFSFRANDGKTDSNVATVSITVNAVNDAPVARDGSASVAAGSPLDITLRAYDVDEDALTFVIAAVPANGALSSDDGDSLITYTPDDGFTGDDTFTFVANDGLVDSNVATVTVSVTGDLVSIAGVSTGKSYSLATVGVGSLYYIDRRYVITELAAELNGMVLVRTANSDKYVTEPDHLTLRIGQEAVISVCYDKRWSVLPDWLDDGTWTFQGSNVTVTDLGASPMEVFEKTVPAGDITLGGNMAGGAAGARSNYVVVVRPAGTLTTNSGDTILSFASRNQVMSPNLSPIAFVVGPIPADEWINTGDSDGDGLSDAFEISQGLDPENADTDSDGVFDEYEEGPDGMDFFNLHLDGFTPDDPGDPGSGGGGGGGGCFVAAGKAAIQ